MNLRGLVRAMTMAVAAACIAWAAAASAQPSGAALHTTYEKLAPSLANSPFGRPIALTSGETANGLKGDVYGVVDHPLAELSATLGKLANWCDMLLLHLNNRACRVDEGKQTVALSVVRRYDVPVDEAFVLTFQYRLVSAKPDHFDAKLNSGEGPLGTRNYRVSVEGISLENGKSFIHFSYAYDQGSATRVATQGYLATFGRGKVGFTVVGKQPSGDPELVSGMLGLVERNAMRYFLAVDAYLAAPDALEKRLSLWYAATEKYPRQLHDLSEADYFKFKRMDRERQGRPPS